MKDQPLLVFDGTESANGRALFTLSALHWCADWLPRTRVLFIDVTDENVTIAAKALHWDMGIYLELRPEPASHDGADGGGPLADASLYAGVAFRSAGHMRIAAARTRGVPVLLAVQFPDDGWLSASTLLRDDAAHDPKAFAAHLGTVVAPWL